MEEEIRTWKIRYVKGESEKSTIKISCLDRKTQFDISCTSINSILTYNRDVSAGVFFLLTAGSKQQDVIQNVTYKSAATDFCSESTSFSLNLKAADRKSYATDS
jgi:hypothetical protein